MIAFDCDDGNDALHDDQQQASQPLLQLVSRSLDDGHGGGGSQATRSGGQEQPHLHHPQQEQRQQHAQAQVQQQMKGRPLGDVPILEDGVMQQAPPILPPLPQSPASCPPAISLMSATARAAVAAANASAAANNGTCCLPTGAVVTGFGGRAPRGPLALSAEAWENGQRQRLQQQQKQKQQQQSSPAPRLPASDARDYVGVTRVLGARITWVTHTQIYPVAEKKYHSFWNPKVRLRGGGG